MRLKAAKKAADPIKSGSYLFRIHSTFIKHQPYTRCRDDFLDSDRGPWPLPTYGVTGKQVVYVVHLSLLTCAADVLTRNLPHTR